MNEKEVPGHAPRLDTDSSRPDGHAQSAAVGEANAAAASRLHDLLAASPGAGSDGRLSQMRSILASTSDARRARVAVRLTSRFFSGFSWDVVQRYLSAHWPAISASVALAVGATVLSDGLVAALLALLATTLGIDGAVTAAEEAFECGQRWVTLASHAHGDEEKLDAACEQFLLMVLSMGGAALALVGARVSAVGGEPAVSPTPTAMAGDAAHAPSVSAPAPAPSAAEPATAGRKPQEGRRGVPRAPDERMVANARARLQALPGAQLTEEQQQGLAARRATIDDGFGYLIEDPWEMSGDGASMQRRRRTLPLPEDAALGAIIHKAANGVQDHARLKAYLNAIVTDAERLAITEGPMSGLAARCRKVLVLRARARGQSIDSISGESDDFFTLIKENQGAVIDRAFVGAVHGAFSHVLQMDYLATVLTAEEMQALTGFIATPAGKDAWMILFDTHEKSSLQNPRNVTNLFTSSKGPVPLETYTHAKDR